MERVVLKTHKSRSVTSIIIINLVMSLIASTTTGRSSVFAELVAKSQQATAQKPSSTDVRDIKVAEPIERELSGGGVHTYSVSLTQGQYLKVIVDQKGIDVIIRVFAPDGQKLREVNETPAAVVESTFLIADAAGMYRVEVEASSKDAKAGIYEIKIEEIREATSKDRAQVAALKVFEEANKLRDQQTADSRRKAIQKYEESLPLWRKAEDRQGEADTFNEVGGIYWQLTQNEKALESYDQALLLYRAVKNHQYEAAVLNNIGDVYVQKSEMQKAVPYFTDALTLSRNIKDRQGEATALGNLGRTYSLLGELRRALEYHEQALSIRRELGDKWREAVALINIGAVYDSIGEFHKTLEYYGQALPLVRLVGQRSGEGVVLNNIGQTYSKLGELRKALEYYEQSLSISRLVGNRLGEGYTLDNIGAVYNQLSEPQKALQHYNEALEIRRAINDRAGQAITLHNIGTFYMFLNEPRQALEYFEQALSIRRAVGDRRREAATLDSVGSVYSRLGDWRKALDYHNQSLTLRRTVGDRYGEAASLNNIGAAYHELGELEKALEYSGQSLELRRTIGDRSGEAATLHIIGSSYGKLRQADKAIEYYTHSLALSRAVGFQSQEAATLLSIARLERERGNTVAARRQIEDSLNIIESTRAKVTSQDLRSSYLASRQDYYMFYIDLLMQMHQREPSAGYDALALTASERARARSLLELLAEARVDVKQGIAPALKQREKDVQSRISWAQNQLIRANSFAQPDKTKVATLEEEFKKLEGEREQVEVEIRQKHPRYSTLHYPAPLDLKAVQKLLDDKTVLLEYSLGEEASYLFAIGQKEFLTARLPAASVITAQVNALREAVAVKPDRTALSNYFQRSRSLYRDLVQPAARLLSGKRALIIVPDGILHYLPFEALLQTDSGSKSQIDLRQLPYMIRNYSISYAPSATVLAGLRRDRADRNRRPNLVGLRGSGLRRKTIRTN